MAERRACILIAGGGFGGLFTALELAGAGEVTLVSADDHFLFKPMLYEYLSGEVEAWHIAPYYKELLDERVRFIQGTLTDVDLAARTATISGRARPLAYDALVVAVGGVTDYVGVAGAAEHAFPFRRLKDADALRQRMVDALDRIPPDAAAADASRAATFAVVGAGASGVELATKMADLLHDAFGRRGLGGEARVFVLEAGPEILPGMGASLRAEVEQVLRAAHVEVRTEARVRRVTPGSVVFEHGGAETELQTAACVWVAGVRPNPLIERLDLPKTERGLLRVRPTLQVEGREEVFALGDGAQFDNADPHLAGTAQLAFQQAALAAANVRAVLAGDEPRTRHIKEMGEALSLGTERAAVLTGGQAFTGALARQARFAMYTQRLPTWQHRLKVSASWFFEGTTPRPLGLRGAGT
ncbi:MAG TPA: NAD(P)/FAD-dependent oxidoreductase [Pyrinomonadaceae bacterium]|jgi:NADH dehydrogenase